MSSTLKNLEISAIGAAKANDWAKAITINQEILTQNPEDIDALNRLGFAYLQLQKTRLATKTFGQVLQLEKNNPIALKQLANIKKRTIVTPQFSSQNFVEEPSKSKIIALHRLTHKQILEKLSIGQELNLKLKTRFISVETPDKTYLGSLPEDISLRLSDLIQKGNQYVSYLHSCSGKHCHVFIKETYQSPSNRNTHSFISNYQPEKDESIGEDLLLLTDEVPLNIVDDHTENADDTHDYSPKPH
jgi:tetratricopeptide (TPR) repeat protein